MAPCKKGVISFMLAPVLGSESEIRFSYTLLVHDKGLYGFRRRAATATATARSRAQKKSGFEFLLLDFHLFQTGLLILHIIQVLDQLLQCGIGQIRQIDVNPVAVFVQFDRRILLQELEHFYLLGLAPTFNGGFDGFQLLFFRRQFVGFHESGGNNGRGLGLGNGLGHGEGGINLWDEKARYIYVVAIWKQI